MVKAHHTRVSRAFALGSSIYLAAGWVPVEAAEQPVPHQLDVHIAAQPLESALAALADQTGLQFAYHGKIDAGLSAPEVSGHYTVDAALLKILHPAGLTYHYINARTVVIDRATTATSLQTRISSVPDPALRLASVETRRDFASNDEDSSSGGDQSKVIAQVVVTAQKREERLIDVPVSVVAMSSDELEKRRIADVDDLAFAVPGLSIESTGWQRRIQLRGIGNGQGNFSLIGLYFDEADVTTTGTAQLDLSTYDLARVEVLRGPQGTLYGEGSAGGTLRFITNSPGLTAFRMTSDLATAFTQDGAPSQRINTMVNIPLISGSMGLRVAGTFDHEGGWINQPAADRIDINEQNKTDVRVKWLWKPDDRFTADAMYTIHRNDASTNLGEDGNGNYTQVWGLTTTPQVKDDYELYDLTLTYDFGPFRVLNTASYVDQDRNSKDFGYISVSNPGVPTASLYFDLYEPINRIATDELRLSSNGKGAWTWTVGGIYRHAELKLNEIFNYGLSDGPVGVLLNAGNDTLSKSWAAFGDTNYKLFERLTLGAGLRYFDDQQTYTAGPTVQNGSFHTTNPRAYAEFKVVDDVNIYTSAAKGFRSGGFNSLNQPSYGPESVWTYEFGTKTSLLGHSLNTDIALFYSNYSNYQIVGITSTGLDITSNAGDARIKGIEWQTTWRPAEQWTLAINGDYVDTSFNRIDVANSAFALGDELPFIPRYTATASVQRDFTVLDKESYVRLDFNRQGRESTRNRSIGTLFYGESDVINMLNLNVGAAINSSLTVSAFAQNLLNDRGYTDPYGFIHDAARSRPRTAGLQFTVAFE